MLDNNKTMQEIYSICKKFEEMRLFSKKIPFNSSELQLLKQVVVARSPEGWASRARRFRRW